MAFGFTPKHEEDLYLDKFTPQQFLSLAIETAKKVEWRIDFISETGFIANTNKGRFKRNSEITFKMDEEKATIKSESTGSEMMDWGINKKTIKRFTDTFIDFKYSIKPEELDKKFEELKPTLAPKAQDVLSQPPQTTAEKITDFFSFFKPRKGYFITPILVDINVLIWIAMVCTGVHWLLPDNDSLLKWGANFRPMTLEGEWWRLITNCFLHIGIIHLLMNMYALLYIGLLLEPRLGRTKFVAAYFLTGITASVTSLWWHDLTISAGASGAIFGMYGVFLATLTTNLIEKTARKTLLTSIGIFVFYNLAYGMKGGIDNAAHVGGLIGGIIIGYAYFPSLKKPDAALLKLSTIGILTVLILTTSFIIYKKVPNDIPKYDEKMKSFIAMEQKALEIYHMPQSTPREKLLTEIKERGLYYWNENLKLMNEVDALNLPEPIHDKNKKLISYCNLRIKSYELIYKAVDEDTDRYKNEIQEYTMQIESLIKDLSGK
jgi:rhomboid protease GluP